MNWATMVYHEYTYAALRLVQYERRALAKIAVLWSQYAAQVPATLGAKSAHIKDLKRAARALVNREWQQIVAGYAAEVGGAVGPEMQAAAAYFKAEVENALVSTNPLAFELIPFHHVPEGAILAATDTEFLGTSLKAWEKHMTAETLRAMSTEYVTSLAAGYGMRETADRLMRAFGKSRTSAERLARTGIMAAANRARDEVHKANRHLIKAELYTATLDTRTCEICAGYDGNTYEVGAPKPYVPVHVQCRCTYTPVMKSAAELGLGDIDLPPSTRESMDGQVPESLTYPEWFRQQDAARQQAIIAMQYSKKKAAMFAAGEWKPSFLGEGREEYGFLDMSPETLRLIVEREQKIMEAVECL